MQLRTQQSPDGQVSNPEHVSRDIAAPAAITSERHLSLLNALLNLLLDDLPLERQLAVVLDTVLTMWAVPLHPQGAVFLADEHCDALTMVASRNLSAACASCAPLQSGQWLCGRSAASGNYQLTDNATAQCMAENGAEMMTGRYAMPLRKDGKTLGVLMLGLDTERLHSNEELGFLNGIAGILAGMIAHSRNAQHIRQILELNRQLNRQILTKQEDEYRRIARELHDEIGQSIAAIKTEVALISHAPARGEIPRSAQAIGDEVDRIYEIMHETVQRLRPGVLDDLGLVPAIEAYVADWQGRRPAMSCRLNVEGQFDDLDETVRVTVYRLIQECLTNVVRHATATEVRIALTRGSSESRGQRGWLVVEVADNGRGINLAKLHEQKGRFGLLGMRERVEGLAGIFSIETAAGSGFRLRAWLPLIERRATPRPER